MFDKISGAEASADCYDIRGIIELLHEVIAARGRDIGRAEGEGVANAIAAQSVKAMRHVEGCCSQYSREIAICEGWIKDFTEMKGAGKEIAIPKSSYGRNIDSLVQDEIRAWGDYKSKHPVRTGDTNSNAVGSSENRIFSNNQ
jgi:hypothetical protein